MERIEEPRNERSRATRARILDAAADLLSTGEVGGLTMASIAEASGVSRRGLYLHFRSRGQVLTELFGHLDERLGLAESVAPLLAATDPDECLDAWARHTAGYHLELLPFARAVDRARRDDPDARALWDTAMAAWRGACTMVVGRIVDAGRLAPPWTPATAVDLLWALMSIDLVDDLANECAWQVEELADRLSLLARRTLLTTA